MFGAVEIVKLGMFFLGGKIRYVLFLGGLSNKFLVERYPSDEEK